MLCPRVTCLSMCICLVSLSSPLHARPDARTHIFEQDSQKLEIKISGGPSGANKEQIFLLPGHHYQITAMATPTSKFRVTAPPGLMGQAVRVPPLAINLSGEVFDPPAPIIARFDDGNSNENNTVTITVPCSVVEVLAVPPPEIQDGLPSESFTVAVHPPGVTINSRLWQWKPHNENAARLPPDPCFDNPEAAAPIITKAWWHSETGSDLIKSEQGNPQDGAPNDRAIHRIRCIVTIQDTPVETEWVHWNVFVFKQTPGVSPPDIEGVIPTANIVVEKLQGSNNHVANLSPNGPNDNPFTRTAPALNTGDMVAENSFWNKIIIVHEGKHMEQWTDEESEWFTLYQPDFLWNEIREMRAESFSDIAANNKLRDTVRAKSNTIYENWEGIRKSTWWKRELEAHGASNPVAPQFLNSNLAYWTEQQPQQESPPRNKGDLWPLQ